MSFSVADLMAQAVAYNEALPLPEERTALPEFAFSPRGPRWERLPAGHSGIAPHLGPMAPPKPHVAGGPVEGLGKDETTWRQMGTVFPAPITTNTKPPAGTAPTLEGLAHYFSRMDSFEAEWRAIAATQNLELPTVGQELAASGISSVSLSSSRNDDEDAYDAPEDYTEALACRYGTAYLTHDLADLVRRIEWERYVTACSPAQRIWLEAKPDGGFTVKTDSVRLTRDDLLPIARRLKAALGERTAEDLANDRARAAHYGVVGSKMIDAPHVVAHVEPQSFDDLGAEDHEESESNGGPSELGLHQFEEDGILDDIRHPRTGLPESSGAVAYEPSESVLWPEEGTPEYSEDPDPAWLPEPPVRGV